VIDPIEPIVHTTIVDASKFEEEEKKIPDLGKTASSPE
jgi:hypothetical protein